MFYSPRLYLLDHWIQWPLGSSLLANLVGWWYLLGHIHPTGDPIFLHYTILFGVDYIGSWHLLLLPAVIGLLMIAVNFIFSFVIYRKSRFFSRLLALSTGILEVFLIVALVLIVGLNS